MTTNTKRCPDCGGDGNHKRTCRSACPSGKHRFRAEQEAQMALTEAKIAAALYGSRRRREERVYYCPTCTGFHLTSRGAPSR